MRSEEESLLSIGLFSNKAMNKAFLVGMAMQLSVLCLPPLQPVFSTAPLSGAQWGAVLGLAAAPVAVCELTKAVSRWGKKEAARDAGPAGAEIGTRRRTSVRH